MLRYWHWSDYTTRLPSRCTISVYQMFLTFRYIYFFFHQVVRGLLFENFFQIHFRFEMCTIDVTVINFCWLSGLLADPVIHLQHPTPLAMPHTGHVSFFVFIRIKSEGTYVQVIVVKRSNNTDGIYPHSFSEHLQGIQMKAWKPSHSK